MARSLDRRSPGRICGDCSRADRRGELVPVVTIANAIHRPALGKRRNDRGGGEALSSHARPHQPTATDVRGIVGRVSGRAGGRGGISDHLHSSSAPFTAAALAVPAGNYHPFTIPGDTSRQSERNARRRRNATAAPKSAAVRPMVTVAGSGTAS